MDASLIESVQPLYEWLGSIMMPWGLVVLFILAFIESIYLIGMITPGEVVVVAAALVAAGGSVPIGLVLIVAWAGSIGGVILGYVVGRRIGLEGIRGVVRAWNGTFIGKVGKVDVELIDDLVEYFEKHGVMTAFGARFAYGAKSFIPPIAGATCMPFTKFLIATSLGGLIYTSLLTFVGWILQQNALLAGQIMQGIGWFAGAMFVLLFGFAAFVLRRFALRRRERYLAEYGFPHEEPGFIKKQEAQIVRTVVQKKNLTGSIDVEELQKQLEGRDLNES